MKQRLKPFHIYGEITRVDEAERTVEGYAFVNEVVDGEGGIRLRRTAMEAATKDYMQWCAVRAMHQPLAAGTAKAPGCGVEWNEKGAFLRVVLVGPVVEPRRAGREPLVRKGAQINLYVEGGGDSDATRTELRRAFTTLLRNTGVARLPRIVACEGHGTTLENFPSAIENRSGSERDFLLVNSESAVTQGDSEWAQLQREDGWSKPKAATEGTVFLMVHCRETWILADLETLRKYCGPGYNGKAIPAWPGLEAVPKKTAQTALSAAIRAGKPHAKGQVSFELLARVDRALLQAACPAARRILDAMRAL